MLLFALYLTLGRKFRHHPTVWLYVTPMDAFSALASLAFTPLLTDWSPIDWRVEAPLVLLLAIVPTVLGHSLTLAALRYMRGQVVSVVNMGQFFPAGVIAWFLLEETPQISFYPDALLILLAGYIAIMSDKEASKVDPSLLDV